MWYRVLKDNSVRKAAVCAGVVLAFAGPAAADPTSASGGAAAKSGVARTDPKPPEEPKPIASAEPEPHHLRTLGEMAFGLGGFAVGYWTLQATQQPDWDYPSVWGRFDGSAWRFDNNQLIINYWLHPLAGGEMYALARANHHGPLAAAGYSTLSSFLWEFVFEYRELVSVNDVLSTSFPGIAIGEFLHKLGLYLDSADHPGAAMQATQWVLTPGHQFDRWLDGRKGSDVVERDELGLRADIWHRFEVGAKAGSGLADDGKEYPVFGAGFQGAFVSLPGYRKPRSFSTGFASADFASLGLETEASQHGPGLHMTAETLLAGYHHQDLRLDPGRRDRSGHVAMAGTTFTTGVSLAYTYLESHAHDFRELLGAFHMPGVRVTSTAHSWLGQAALSVRANPDFVGVSAYGYDQWQALHPGELGKHILRNQGYHYAWGGSGVLEADAALGPVEFDGSLFLGRWRSQEGLNRWQERITLDVPARTDLVWYRASARVQPGRWPLSFGAWLQLRRWNTSVGEVRRHERSLVRGVEARFRF